MSILNSLLRSVVDALLSLFRGLPEYVSLTVFALVLAVVALYIFKWTSNQDKIEAVKRKIYAGLFEIRLFNDDLRNILRAIVHILSYNLRYIGHSLVPLLVMIVPFVLVMAQLQYQYGFKGLVPGQVAYVKVELKDDFAADFKESKPPVELVAPRGLRVEQPAMWAYPIDEMSWRVVPEEWGSYELEVQWNGTESVTKSVLVSEEKMRLRSPARIAPNFLEELITPAEDPLPEEAPIQRIELTYEPVTSFFDLCYQLWILVALSIVFAFILAKPLGIKL